MTILGMQSPDERHPQLAMEDTPVDPPTDDQAPEDITSQNMWYDAETDEEQMKDGNDARIESDLQNTSEVLTTRDAQKELLRPEIAQEAAQLGIRGDRNAPEIIKCRKCLLEFIKHDLFCNHCGAPNYDHVLSKYVIDRHRVQALAADTSKILNIGWEWKLKHRPKSWKMKRRKNCRDQHEKAQQKGFQNIMDIFLNDDVFRTSYARQGYSRDEVEERSNEGLHHPQPPPPKNPRNAYRHGSVNQWWTKVRMPPKDRPKQSVQHWVEKRVADRIGNIPNTFNRSIPKPPPYHVSQFLQSATDEQWLIRPQEDEWNREVGAQGTDPNQSASSSSWDQWNANRNAQS